MTLEPLHTAAEVAEAFGYTERYVRDRCRAREWPYRRGLHNRPMFSAEDIDAIKALIARPVEQAPEPRIAFAPRSGRRSA